ncbi:hypothetical protein [Staphylococcus saprophyticus]|uniref:hypothetical protein n=1 Tax=Staphylococcus saprophyticus TaxID=29385 RepID=UPI002DBE8C74|nr:hypothetical protein [Staphylococcus saprophyticus]MEB6799946.1 hypothetical protein [Staphylococcus saprophyticus]
MNITITILSCIVLYLVITKLVQRSEIKSLKYELEKKHTKVNQFVVDSENKIVILHLENGLIKPSTLEIIRNDFQELEEKGYYAIVLDKTFEANQKRLSFDTVTKIKEDLNKEDN